MVESVRVELERDMACLDVLGCIHGLNERDQGVFRELQRAGESLTVDDVANRLGCERSTAYRSITRLLEVGVVTQRQVNYNHGGYYYVYRPNASEAVARDMQRLLNDWYATVSQLVGEFENRYGRDADDRERQSVQSRS